MKKGRHMGLRKNKKDVTIMPHTLMFLSDNEC